MEVLGDITTYRATMTKILISGGAGFIGRHLPNKLLSQKKKQ
jgi:hypothetical protein